MTKTETMTAFSLAQTIIADIREGLEDAVKYEGQLLTVGNEVVINGVTYNYTVGRSDLTNDVSPWAVYSLITVTNGLECNRLAKRVEKLINIENIA